MDYDDGRKCVLTGSANFSERAFAGKQNEGYILFEDDEAAWEHYSSKYEQIKATSTLAVPKHALLSEKLDPEDLPLFSSETKDVVIVTADAPPESDVVHKVVTSKTPKHFAGLASVIPKKRGSAVLDGRVRKEAVRYMKSNSRSEKENPEEYLSINATSQDTFETEVRKRCFVVYTGASLRDDDPEGRRLTREVKAIKGELGTAMYREYLKRVMTALAVSEEPPDFLALSSEIIRDIVGEHSDAGMPDWCVASNMDAYRKGRHDKVREDLKQLLASDPGAWEKRCGRWTLRVGDQNAANRLRRDVPDYLLGAGNASNLVVFDTSSIEDFVGRKHFRAKRSLMSLFRRP